MRAGSRFGINSAALLAAAAVAAIGNIDHSVKTHKDTEPLPRSSHGKRSKKKRRK